MKAATIAMMLLATGLPAGAAVAQTAAPVSGDAIAGLVSRLPHGEMHLLVEPRLSARRLVLKLVAVNRSGAPAAFGEDAITVATTDGTAVALVPRDMLLAQFGGEAASNTRETSTAHVTAALPIANAAGQRDVTGYSGGMATGTAGIPSSALESAERRAADPAARARADAALLKPMTIPAGRADGGQIMTQPLKHGRAASLIVTVAFAGDTHRFEVAVPR